MKDKTVTGVGGKLSTISCRTVELNSTCTSQKYIQCLNKVFYTYPDKRNFQICGGLHCCQMVDYHMRVWPDEAINGQPLSTGILTECRYLSVAFSCLGISFVCIVLTSMKGLVKAVILGHNDHLRRTERADWCLELPLLTRFHKYLWVVEFCIGIGPWYVFLILIPQTLLGWVQVGITWRSSCWLLWHGAAIGTFLHVHIW